MKTTQNIKPLKQQLKKLNCDYFLIPNSDEFASEYLPEYAKRLQFITGFTGSNGFAIVGTKDRSAFFTDGRYTLQAATEVDGKDFEIYNLAEKSPLNWLLENAPTGSKIGFDAKLHSINFVQNYQKHFGKRLIALDTNPTDKAWKDQPSPPNNKIFKHPIKYSGLSSKNKIKKIISTLDAKTDAIILTNPASICWLLNIRSNDVEYSPLLLSYAIIDKNGDTKLFKNHSQLTAYNLQPISIQLDFSQANYQLYDTLQQHNINIVNKTDPCLILKAIKNPTEIKNAIKAHQIDGLAVTKFLFWLEQSLSKKQNMLPSSGGSEFLRSEAQQNDGGEYVNEISASQKLLELRQTSKKFLYPSFATIAGFGSNGAIVHYHASPKTNKTIKGNSLFLIDSGGQYLEGTTDITRTVAVGKPTSEMIENFTRVLKGHIAIARAKFPADTTGHNLDILARYHLWQKGLDYDHGTGHGVGSFSSVHESPPSISKRNDSVPLQAGMILSNEPGYYQEGQEGEEGYGIRIENLLLVEKCQKINSKTTSKNSKENSRQFLQFKTLTLAPIDQRLIDFKMLTYPEKKWLKEYHLRVYEELKSGLDKEEKEWLKKIANNEL